MNLVVHSFYKKLHQLIFNKKIYHLKGKNPLIPLLPAFPGLF
jgi:hypothetical protein